MLLTLDTSGPLCSAALYDCAENILLYERSEELGRGHAERLMPMLEQLLAEASIQWSAITRLGVVNGPGSFTGLRVGLATARGLALALNVPCNGLTVFQAFAAEYGTSDALAVVIDAKRDQIWMQCFEGGQSLLGPVAIAIDEIVSQVPSSIACLAGSAANTVKEALSRDVVVLGTAASPSIAAAARLVASQKPAADKPIPLYLREPDAKPQGLVERQS